MKFHILAGYILALTIAGFFLWLLRGFVRWLRRKDAPAAADPDLTAGPESPAGEAGKPDKVPVDWPVNIFLSRGDDLELPGRMEALTMSGAFLRCSAPLRVGQGLDLYIDVPDGERCRVTARVLWVGEGKGQHPAAQVRFEGLAAAERERLRRVARSSRAQ